MSERKYTVSEIDNLRIACDMRWSLGTTNPRPGVRIGRSYYGNEKTVAVEEMVRTYMTAGLTAEDLMAADKAACGRNNA